MNAEELAAIRERHASTDARRHWCPTCNDPEFRALLAHIDALTAKVEGLPTWPGMSAETARLVSRAAVLATLRGEA